MVITGTVNYVVAAVASTVRTVLITTTSRGSTVVAHSNNKMKKDQELKMERTVVFVCFSILCAQSARLLYVQN